MSVLKYAKALLEDIERHKSAGAGAERVAELEAELEKVKADALSEAHKLYAETVGKLGAVTLSNGQVVPSTDQVDTLDTIKRLGGDAPTVSVSPVETDPVEPSIVVGPLAASPANLVAGDGSDPIKTPPVVVAPGGAGVATVVAPSAPEGDLGGPAGVVNLPAEAVVPDDGRHQAE